MEGLIIKGSAPAGTGSGWSSPVQAARGEKPSQPSTNQAPQVDQTAALAESNREISVRNHEATKALAERLQSFLDSTRYSLQFVPDSKNGRVIIKVLDNSGEVVRQIPPEYISGLSKGLESFTGLLVDETLK